jgi:2-dehydropantoate 2-reductase
VIVGAGAIGLLVAGRLAQSGQRCVLLARPSAAALAERPLRIAGPGAEQSQAQLAVITAPDQLGPTDREPELAILCVKGYDTAGALPALERLGARHVLTLQNGIGNEERLAQQLGAGRVISGAITISVEVTAPGQIAVAKSGGIGIAPMRLEDQPAAARAAAALRLAGFEVIEALDYRALKWSKALLNMLGNATAAILDMSVAEVYADPRLVDLERRAFLEALAVMDRLRIAPINLPRYPAALLAAAMRRVPPALLRPLLRRVIAGGRGGKPPSLQLDLARGSARSEGEFLYGAVARVAQAAGLQAPVNRALWDTLASIASGRAAWESFRHQPERLLAVVAAGAATAQSQQAR